MPLAPATVSARFGNGQSELISLMWRNDYASPPVEGSLTEELRREVEVSGRSASAARIKSLVQAERCACEARNPQGSCCLGDVTAVAKAAEGTAVSR